MVSKITDLIRSLINDLNTADSESIIWTTGDSYTIAQENVSSVTKITKNGYLVSTNDYSFDSNSLIVTFTSGAIPSTNDVVVIYYNYNKWSSTEILGFIKSALVYLVTNQYTNFELSTDSAELYPIPSQEQQKLIALIASVLINPNWSRYSLGGTTTVFPRKDDKDTKIKKIINTFKRSLGIIGVIKL